jgi:hypothetical protein
MGTLAILIAIVVALSVVLALVIRSWRHAIQDRDAARRSVQTQAKLAAAESAARTQADIACKSWKTRYTELNTNLREEIRKYITARESLLAASDGNVEEAAEAINRILNGEPE